MSRELPAACREAVALQCGVISREQAILAGLTPDDIRGLVRRGYWQRLQRGAYAVFTGPPPREAVLWAVLHRAGPGAVLSHQTAAELSGLSDEPSGPVHLTIPACRQAVGIAGAVIHRSTRVATARHPALLPPRTRVEETVLDLVDQAETFERAFAWISAACQRRLTTVDHLSRSLEERTKIRWRQDLGHALIEAGGGVHSLLEYHYVHDVERPHGLPRAERQTLGVHAGRSYYRDNQYAAYRVCVELDGRIAHPDHKRWKDRRRDNLAAVDGLVTLKFDWADVTRHPCRTAWFVARALQQGGWPGQPRRCGSRCLIQRAGRPLILFDGN